MSCEDENLVDYFIVATKKHDGSSAELAFVYPPIDDDPDETEFCENVTMFTYPHGYVDSWDGRSLPPPPAHNLFTLTDAQGDHLFGASVSFFETSKHHVKSLCLLSRRPFYTQLLRYLEQLLLLGLWQARDDDSVPKDAVERSLCNLFHEVPVPYRGLAVQMQIAELELTLDRAPFLDFPFEMDMELMLYTFMVVDPKVLQQLYHHVLLEHRVLVIGNDSVLVTAVVETLKALVFPFTWLHAVIPNIPDSLDLDTLLDAPVPFLAGAHAAQLKNVSIPSNVVKYDLNESRLVVQNANNQRQQPHQMDLESVVLPTLPDASSRLLQKLVAARLPDLATQKKELHQRLWDRRIQLQKCCMASSTTNSSTTMPVVTPKSFFLVKHSLVHKKMMKQYLELMAVLLQDFAQCISHQSKQLEADKFVDKRPPATRPFFRALVDTAHFQSFVANHNDYVAGQLALEDAMKFHYVHKTLLSVERLTGNQADASVAVAVALTKTFVANTPQVVFKPEATINSTKPQLEVVFPAIDVDAFGEPRQIQFPRMSTDAVHSSLGTFLSPAGTASRRASKDTSDWMQTFLKTVPSLPTPSKLLDPLTSSASSSSTSNNSSERSKLSIFGSTSSSPAIPLPRPAPFKRSRTIDRLKNASPFYRTMTQKALDSTLSSLASAASTITNSSSLSSSPPPPPTRPSTVVRSIWLITTSSCKCSEQVVALTQKLVEQLQLHETKTATAVADAYCALIDTLSECGHPSEAKAVFEECLSGSALVSLATIASLPHFWKPFSALLKCYISNRLVQRAFDLLVQVQLEEEQLLDPSLGTLQFPAQVLSAEKQPIVERIYVTFTSGNLGMCLAPRVITPNPQSSGTGCELISFQEHDTKDVHEPVEKTSGLRVHDVLETINGEFVMHAAFPDIITALKQASRPMTVTFIRGIDRLNVLTDPDNGHGHHDLLRRSSSSASLSSTSAVVDGKSGIAISTKHKPRRDLCDRFGLLPKQGIRVTALADCGNCGSRLSLAQVQSGWSSSDANDYTTKCSGCGHRFVPKLCVMLGVMTTMYRPQTRVTRSSRLPSTEQLLQDAKVEQYEYLSMPVIRKELSNLAQKVPLTLLSMKDLREMNPRIYWNIVVKLLSLEVPLDFLQLPDMTVKPTPVPAPVKEVLPPKAVKAKTGPSTTDDEEEMRVLRDMVLSRAAKVKSENQKTEDVLSSVFKALEQQAKQELQAKAKPSGGSTRWSLLGRLYPGAARPMPVAEPTTKSVEEEEDDRSDDGQSEQDDEEDRRESSSDERETDVEDMRSTRTISVNESTTSEDQETQRGVKNPTRNSKFMPSLSTPAPFSRITRTTTHHY